MKLPIMIHVGSRRLELQKKLGSGQYGRVFAAKDLDTHEELAVKILAEFPQELLPLIQNETAILKARSAFFGGAASGVHAPRYYKNLSYQYDLEVDFKHVSLEKLAALAKEKQIELERLVIVTKLHPGINLLQHQQQGRFDNITWPELQALICAMAEELADFQRTTGCIHGDLNLGNWLWDDEQSDLVTLIDYERSTRIGKDYPQMTPTVFFPPEKFSQQSSRAFELYGFAGALAEILFKSVRLDGNEINSASVSKTMRFNELMPEQRKEAPFYLAEIPFNFDDAEFIDSVPVELQATIRTYLKDMSLQYAENRQLVPKQVAGFFGEYLTRMMDEGYVSKPGSPGHTTPIAS